MRRFRVWLANLLWPNDLCRHLWTNWSDPGRCDVAETDGYGNVKTIARTVDSQNRRCLNCNIEERRILVLQ